LLEVQAKVEASGKGFHLTPYLSSPQKQQNVSPATSKLLIEPDPGAGN